VKVMMGAAVPLLVVVAYFYWEGALADLWDWTIVFNYKVYRPETARGLKETAALLWKVLLRVFGLKVIALGFSLIGYVMFAVERVRARRSSVTADEVTNACRDAILLPPTIYLAFCALNFQSGPDLIPLFPFIGIFAGWLLAKAGQTIPDHSALKAGAFGRAFLRWLPSAAVLVVAAAILAQTLAYRIEPGSTLQEQERKLAPVAEALGPDDRIYAHGMAEILVLLNRPNLNPYIYLDNGKDRFADARTPGGFAVILSQMEAEAPKVVALGRLGKVARRGDLERWVQEQYEAIGQIGNGVIYRRKSAGQ
jgi:hypothetical protein